jgi:glyoxalase family protein
MIEHGLHHVTAIAGPARRNLDFYAQTLGLRLVKRTVNFDDPGTWHLYYGDAAGQPGTLVTFFPWANAAPGRLGAGETREILLRVPAAAIGYWTHRLVEQGVAHELPSRRFGAPVLSLRDRDGLRLALVGIAGAEAEPAWSDGTVPAEHAIRGLHGVSLLLEDVAPTAAVLTDVLGFAAAGQEDGRLRYRTGAALGGVVELEVADSYLPARLGAGSVHHIAFRAADDATQAAMVERLASEHGLQATGQKDRNYFRSVYFREPGGVLFEIATEQPGFAIDEPAETLGAALQLPLVLEPRRAAIEAALPPLV